MALVCVASAVVAVAAALWSTRAIGPTAHDGRHGEELQILWQLEAEWGEEVMSDTRARAAAALLEERPDRGIDEVLRFLDQVGYIVRKYGVDQELVWYRFYWQVACYWKAASSLRQPPEKMTRERYAHLRWLVSVLESVEQRRMGRAVAAEPTPEQVRDFLLAEARGGSCGEEEESTDGLTQMTPL